jgi:hypothetical protein
VKQLLVQFLPPVPNSPSAKAMEVERQMTKKSLIVNFIVLFL